MTKATALAMAPAPVGDGGGAWCILRAAGPRTLAVADALAAAGYDAWTPGRTFRRTLFKGTRSERVIEQRAPILPTFVFLRADQVEAVAAAAAHPASVLPAFSLFCVAGRVPRIAASAVQGLREEEAAEAAKLRAIHDAESREAARKVRAELMRHERDRRRALRRRPHTVTRGASVAARDVPALAGLTGVVEAVGGVHAHVYFGPLRWKIEGWMLTPQP